MFVRSVLKEVKMSDAIHYMPAYTQLTDNVLQQVMMSSKLQLQKVGNTCIQHCINYSMLIMMQAQQLLRQVKKRNLYEFVDQTKSFPEKLKLTEVFVM